jgi:hypothetical protein
VPAMLVIHKRIRRKVRAVNRMSLLGGNEDSVLAAHTRGKLSAHGCDEFLEIVA